MFCLIIFVAFFWTLSGFLSSWSAKLQIVQNCDWAELEGLFQSVFLFIQPYININIIYISRGRNSMILLIHVQLVICRSQQLFSLLQNYLFLICLCAVEYFCIKKKSFSYCHGFFSSETFCPCAKMNFNLKPVLRSAPPPQLYVASRLKYSISVCIILE